MTISVVNGGTEPLVDLDVVNTSTGDGLMGDLDCDFSLLGGPATSTTWAGPLTVGSRFECRSEFSGMAAGGNHETITTVNAINQTTGMPLTLDPPGTPGNPNADYWYAEVLALPTTTTTVPASTTPPTDVTLPETGSTGAVAAIAALLTMLGCTLVVVAARSRRPLRT